MRHATTPPGSTRLGCTAWALACLVLLCVCAAAETGEGLEPDRPASATAPDAARRTVEGRVTGDDGQPLAGADVSLVAVNYHRPFGTHHPLVKTKAEVLAQATADRDGQFTFTARPFSAEREVSLEVFARAAGHGVGWAELDGTRDRQDVALRLAAEQRRRGRAVDARGRPAAGVRLVAASMRRRAAGATDPFWAAPADMRAWPPPTRTGPDGRFAFAGVPPDADLVLEVRHDDEEHNDGPFALQRRLLPGGGGGPEGDGAEPVITLAPSQRVDGTVLYRDTGKPAAGALLVMSSRMGDAYAGGVEARTDASGRFRADVYEGDALGVVVVPPQPGERYRPLERDIPWPAGTATQRMTLPLYGEGSEPVDGTTPDGRPGSTIEVEHPAVAVETLRPGGRLATKLSGTLVFGGSLKTRNAKPAGADAADADAAGAGRPTRGVFAVDLETGRWRLVVEDAYDPRVSPDGTRLAFRAGDGRALRVVTLGAPAASTELAARCVGPAAWAPGSDALVANIHAPARRDYHGEEYWGEETAKRLFPADGGEAGNVIPVPPLYSVWDVSPDGGRVAMHWDTHAYLTGAQLFVARLDGSELRPVACRRSQYYWYPRFSPDGGTLLAKHLDPATDQATVRLLALDGSRERAISLGDGLSPEVACWSPDGEAIAVVAYSGGRDVCKLVVVNRAGTHSREVTLGGAEDVSADQVDWTAAGLVAR